MSDTTTKQRRPVDRNAEAALAQLRRSLEADESASVRRPKISIVIQSFILVFVFGYMTYMYTHVAILDAEALTGIAGDKFEEMIPDLRKDARDYALAMAPTLTDHLQAAFLNLPHTIGTKIEDRLVEQTEKLIAEFETKLEGTLGDILENQIALVQAQNPGGTAEEMLDATIQGISGIYRESVEASIDLMYDDYAREIGKVNDYLIRLKTAPNLTDLEKIDKELIEVWVLLLEAHGHPLPVPGREF